MKKLFLTMAVAAALFTTSAKAETINCTEITAVPFVITVQGVYCFKSDKASAVPNGNLIEIQTNNVTIDLNGFKLGGSGAGTGTNANGIFAEDQKNITIRNGTIRGFFKGVQITQDTGTSSGHLLEDLLLDQNRFTGAQVEGSGNVIRNNRVVNTGPSDGSTAAIGIRLVSASNSVIADNVVSGTSETGTASGIIVTLSALVEVRGNTVLDARDATTKRGIDIGNSTDVTVIGNRILNAAGTGTTGIIDEFSSSTGLNCIDNTVAGFTTALSGCDFSAGNNLVP